MKTYQEKIFESFNGLKNDDKEIDEKKLDDILERIIDLAVKEDRGENIDSNIKAQTNNIINFFE